MKYFYALFLPFVMEISYADVTCYLNIVKDSCWNDFNVNVVAIDTSNRSQVAQATIAKGSKWTRVSFKCNPGQTLLYNATFTPAFWEADKDKVYHATQYWSLPNQLNPGDVAWELTICFPSSFSGVPFPPTAGSDCACQYDQIQPLKLKTDSSSQ
ncbi:hypothetical protein [Legionella sp. W05-934-2]|jgi:hypothetical protein|uniref:hypothetical protein n=1 Tax=Legionella sp. W05-934-2 TaxID=1198649 RepID=UPI003461C16C